MLLSEYCLVKGINLTRPSETNVYILLSFFTEYVLLKMPNDKEKVYITLIFRLMSSSTRGYFRVVC